MSAELIKQVLNSGECPICKTEVEFRNDIYECPADTSHFKLKISFEGGEKITANLNDTVIPPEQLQGIEW